MAQKYLHPPDDFNDFILLAKSHIYVGDNKQLYYFDKPVSPELYKFLIKFEQKKYRLVFRVITRFLAIKK